MKMRVLFLITIVILLMPQVGLSASEVSYTLQGLGAGQWLYRYTVINDTLSEPIRQFIVWFEPGLYENLSIVSDPEIGYDWYQDTVEPDPVWLYYGAYRALAWGDGISVGDYESGFAVSFTYLGAGTPNVQEFDIVDPCDYISLEAGWTIPVYWVDAAAAGNPEQNGTRAKPFGTIQAGIDAAADGFTVRVLPGLYEESIDFSGKAITVASYEATMDNPAVIVGMDNNAVKFHSGETSDSIIEGFIITSSTGRRGITCNTNSSPSIRNNLIVGCGNDDSFESEGTAIQVASGCSPIILFNTITGNYGSTWAEKAVSIDNRDVSFDGIISHCIIYGNSADLLNRGPEFFVPGRIEYCNIGNINDNADWLEGAQVDEYGNFNQAPGFVRSASVPGAYDGDYHLTNGSPCINAGDPCYVPWEGQTDFDNQGRIMFGRVDVGVDEVAPFTEVTRPSSGEVWPAGSRRKIEWDGVGIGNVDIYYSRNNGSTWKPVVSNLANTGSYEWQLPYVDSEQCVVCLVASDEPADIEYTTSDVFTIRISEPGPTVESVWPTLGADSGRRGLSNESGPEVGCVKWQFETEASFYKSVAVGANGSVHIASEDGKLYTVDPNTGTPIWIFDAQSPMTSSPTVGADGTVYVGCMNGRLYAIDKDGDVRWTYDTDAFIYSTPAVSASSDGEVYFGSQDGKLYALGADGTELWTFETGGPGQVGGAILASPVIGQDGSVYIAGGFDSKLYALPAPFHDPNDGTPRWVHDFSDLVDANDYEGLPFASPAVGPDGTIYMLLPNPINLYALSPLDGSIIWTADGAEEPPPPYQHLEGSWQFEVDAVDSSGNGHTGTLQGQADIVYDPQRGNVLSLDGDGDYVEVPDYFGVLGVNPRWVSAWIKTDSAGDIIHWGSYGAGDGAWWLFFVTNNGDLRVSVGGGKITSVGINLCDNAWHEVAAAFEGKVIGDVRLYVDGQRVNTITNNPDQHINTEVARNVRIGFMNNQFYRYFNGLIDDVRIYKSKYHRQSQFLAGHWDFEGNTLDSSGNGRDGVPLGNASLDTDPVMGQVLKITNGYLRILGYEGVTGTAPRTVSAWIKTGVPGEIITWGNEEDGQQWRFQVRDWCSAVIVGNGLFAFSPNYNLINNEWHHVAVSWEDGASPGTSSFKFYIDGNMIEALPPDSVQINTGSMYDVRIGSSPLNNNLGFWGKVDDVRIYDRVVTIAEIFGKDPQAYCWQRPAIGPDGTIYVSYDDNYLRAFNPDGSVKWVKSVGVAGGFTLAVDKDGLIYAASEDSSLYVINSSGKVVSRFDGGDWLSSPVIGPDGTIYICDVENHVLAIDRYACEEETVDLHWAADFNCDGAVGFYDVVMLAFDWMAYGSSTLPLASDANIDMYVDLADFAAVAAKWLDEI